MNKEKNLNLRRIYYGNQKNNNYHHHTQKIFGYSYEVRHSEGMQLFCTVIAATMFLIGGIFTGSVASIINLIAKLFVLIGIGIPAYDYTRGKKTAWRVIYWIALVVYVLGCVFGVMGGLIK